MPVVNAANKIFTHQLNQYLLLAHNHMKTKNDREAMDLFIKEMNETAGGEFLLRRDDSRYFVMVMFDVRVMTALTDVNGKFAISVLEEITPDIMGNIYGLFDNAIRKLYLQGRVAELKLEVEKIERRDPTIDGLAKAIMGLGGKNQ